MIPESIPQDYPSTKKPKIALTLSSQVPEQRLHQQKSNISHQANQCSQLRRRILQPINSGYPTPPFPSLSYFRHVYKRTKNQSTTRPRCQTRCPTPTNHAKVFYLEFGQYLFCPLPFLSACAISISISLFTTNLPRYSWWSYSNAIPPQPSLLRWRGYIRTGITTKQDAIAESRYGLGSEVEHNLRASRTRRTT